MKSVIKQLAQYTTLNDDASVKLPEGIHQLEDSVLESISGAGLINAFSCKNTSCGATINRSCTNESSCYTPGNPGQN